MLNSRVMTIAGGLTLAVLMATGCGRTPAPAPNTTANGDGEAHVHPTEGPHGGELIELGNEEYHAELLHDEQAGTVTIYILDSHAEKVVPIEATELMINMTRDGQAEQFPLAASAEQTDPEGMSSRFVSNDAQLGAGLDHEGAGPQLVVTIAGKQFRGHIEHVHADGEAH